MREIFNQEWEEGSILEPKGNVMIYAKGIATSPLILVGYHKNDGRGIKYEAVVEQSRDFEELKNHYSDTIRLADMVIPVPIKFKHALKNISGINIIQPIKTLRDAIEQYKDSYNVVSDADIEINCDLSHYSKIYFPTMVEQDLTKDPSLAVTCLYLEDLLAGAKQKVFRELDILRMKKLSTLIPDRVSPHLFRYSLELDSDKNLECAGKAIESYKAIIREDFEEVIKLRRELKQTLNEEEQKRLLLNIVA